MWTRRKPAVSSTLRDRRLANAVQGRVNDGDVTSVADRLAHDRGDVGEIDVVVNPTDRAVGEALRQTAFRGSRDPRPTRRRR